MAIRNTNRASPMTASSMNSSAPSSKAADSIEEKIHEMKSNLIRHARSNDRRMVIRSLSEVKLLNCLSLDVAQNPDGPLFDLEKEVAETSIILNGVEVKGVSLYNAPGVKDTVTSGIKNSVIPLLKNVCRELCERKDVNLSSRELYEKLIVRLAKSTSSADPYFRLNSLLGSPDLLVMPMAHDDVEKPTVPPSMRSDEITKTATAELSIYAANGEIHIVLSQTYMFGLMRKADVKSNRPWIMIRGVVNERSNLSTNNTVRQLKVVIPNP